ncbi:small conductance mechanosensitive channel [Cognatiyoonia sediminum]|uniref:Small-conductance mechanosensitive channel n=1 Tax=Cognatiyoonia sediminum TaxID=1508389 RepID=A0A1M5L3F1_9RHOB|nr:mechanosensitive ion channel domain-containing protein [Cognatiyoonia sediminum]SHG59470.1 small conductance mechanosensitive channel [Cognatiyoonia sediminum]
MGDNLNTDAIAQFFSVENLVGILGNVVAAILILIVGFWLAGWVKRRFVKMGTKYPDVDPTLLAFGGNIARYIVLGFAFLFVLNTFGVQTTSIVAIIGAAGLAIGLALQGTLSNVAAGVMIIIFRPFRLGDFVDLNGNLGTVKDITLNYIELASADNVQTIIPNAQVWGNTIVNYSSYDTRRAEWVFGVGYGADLKKTEETIRATIMSDERSLSDPEPFIQVNALGESSVDFLVRVWCASDDYFGYQADMKRKVKEALDANDIPIPFPTRTIIQTTE